MENEIQVLVTGASGFIGRQLCLSLAGQGFKVRGLCRNLMHPLVPRHQNVRPVKGDINDIDSLAEAMRGCGQVYHTAALAKMWVPDASEFYSVNVTGTRNVLDCALRQKVKRVVYTSSCGVLGPTIKHPMTEEDPRIMGFPIHYERTKYLADLEVKKFIEQGLDIVTVYPSRVYGEGPITGSNTVGKMISGYLRGTWRIIPGSGEAVANYAYLQDVVEGHIAAMLMGKTGNKYILGGEDISFNEFFRTLSKVTGVHSKLFRIPQKVIKAFSHVEAARARLTGLSPVFLPEFADRLNFDQKYSSQKAMTHLQYRITPFHEGLKKTADYIKTSEL
ncbi:NAD-dependent epimerase/dehydratase family protein [Arcticibacter sp. MXS-1]|uniref:NAD-dependent epimerase/dehydratase family protein n=1 Tax=Arcticibacter sp. MXS-1 TaxID=3341726 RepID=UPI0035A86620